MTRRSRQDRADILATLGLFTVAFLLYLRTLAPSVATIYDDSLEFPLVVHRLAIAHPTGYPLYILLGKAFSFLPLGDLAYRINLLSAVSAAGAVAVFYVLARRVGLHPLGSAAAALVLGVSPVFWSQAVVAEVYALNALFVAASLALAVAWAGQSVRSPSLLVATFFILGLSLTHHRTMLLLLPPLLLYLLLEGWRPWVGVKTTLLLLVAFCLPFLLYLYLPWRGMTTSSLDGTYQNTLQGFISWVMAGSYTTFLRDNPLQQEALSAAAYLRLVQDQMGNGGLALAFLGSLWLVLRRRRIFVLVALFWLVVVVFVHLYRVPDAPVFLIPSFMVTSLAAGAGVHALMDARLPQAYVPSRWRGLTIPRLAQVRLLLAGALVLAVLASVLPDSLSRNDRSNDWAVHNYALDVLGQPLEEGATIAGILGEMTLLRYFQETAGLRPDLATLAADDDTTRLAAVTALLSSGKSVYLTRPLAGIEKYASLSAVGPLLQVRPPSAAAVQQPGATALRADFGGLVTLAGYHIAGLPSPLDRQDASSSSGRTSVAAADRLRLTLYWQAMQRPPKDYRVTVRLLTPTGRLLWQSDAGPVYDGYPMTAWRPGETVVDIHDLLVPVGTPPGTCDLQIGLYDPATLQLLPVSAKENLLTIGPIAIVRPEEPINLDSLPRRSPTATPGLLMPGGQFDLSLERLGIERVSHSNLQNEVELYGFGFSPKVVKPGQNVDVVFLWQALRDLSEDRVVFVQLVDENGSLWAAQQSQPADGVYSTRDWRRGEVVRDVHTLMVPADAPDGTYHLEAGMYDPLGQPLTVLRLTRRSLDHVTLGTVQVRGRERLMTVPPTRFPFAGQVGEIARLVGYDLAINDAARLQEPPVVAARPGDILLLTLVWQARETTRTSYTVFVHLVSPDGIVVGQDDAMPGRGTMPTTSWIRGEVIVDSYKLAIPPTARSGEYAILVGMYDATTGARLPTWAGSGESTGDRFLLTKVRVAN